MYSCGLVLEGGGNRAIYTSGVLDAFMDQGITFPYVIGVSAAAAMLCLTSANAEGVNMIFPFSTAATNAL